MPYSATAFANGGAPGISGAELNKLGTQYAQAVADAAADVDSDVSTHAALTTGVHGVGAGTVAKVGDIATDANLSAAAQDAVTKRHTQGSDTALGTLLSDIDMGTNKITNLGTPTANADAVTKLYVDTAMVSGGFLPGMGILWYGLAANCPAGWHICDGTDGTPDMRGRVPKGAALNPGTTGGSATHSHDAHTSLTHSGGAVSSHSGVTVGNHSSLTHSGTAVANHVVTQPSDHAAKNTGSYGGISPYSATGANQDFPMAVHNHSISAYTHAGGAVDAHGVTQPSAHTISAHSVTQPDAHIFTQPNTHTISAHSSASNESPYLEWCFIIKL